MPPSGKISVSTAALRTTSHTAPMSRRLSRFAEYSIVKCGMRFHSLSSYSSGEVAAHRAVGAIVGLNCVALAGLDRTDEGAGEHDLSRLQRKAERRDLVGEPGDGSCGMIEHAGSEARFLKLAVPEAERANPAQVGLQGADRPTAEHD